MALKQIGESELAGKGIAPLPDVPGLPAEEMKRKFEEIVRDVVIPAVNENAANSYDKAEVNRKIGEAVVETGAADMAKRVYDPQGRQEDVFAYAMAQDVYDPQGKGEDIFARLEATEQAAMDVETYDPQGRGQDVFAYVDEAARTGGICEYSHEKVDGAHALEGEGDNIKFVATAGYEEGEAFFVNGTECEAKTTGGEALPGGYFVAGAVVDCFLKGNTLNFKAGGAALDLKVIAAAGVGRLPQNAAENTVALIGSYEIEGKPWCGPTAPMGENLWAGRVFLPLSQYSTAVVSAVKNNDVYMPVGAARFYDGTSWAVAPSKVYLSGKWIDLLSVLYSYGQFYQPYSVFSGEGTAVNTGSYFLLTSQLSVAHSQFLQFAIDLTGVSVLRCVVATQTGGDYYHRFYVGSTAAQGYPGVAGVQNLKSGADIASTYDLNVRALSGVHYVNVGQYMGAWATYRYMKIYQVTVIE